MQSGTYGFQRKGRFVTVTVWRINEMISRAIAPDNGIELLHIYVDKGISGAKVMRTA